MLLLHCFSITVDMTTNSIVTNKAKQRKTMVIEDKLDKLNPKKKKDRSHAPKIMPSIIGDRLNIVILLFLYTLQGVPLGLSAAIPIIMQKKHITYKEQVK